MKVLLSGHQGYIGSVLSGRLLERSHQVTGLDVGWFRDCRFGSQREAEVPLIERDIRDVVATDLEGFDAVIHLASLSNDPLGDLDADLTHDINTVGSMNLASAARQAGVQRFLFSSSCSTYGAAGDDFLDETADFNPVTAYGRAKVDVEAGLHGLAGSNFSPTYLRNATAYGLSPRLRLDLVVNNLVAWAIATGRVYLMSDGTPWRPIVHVDDICSAFLAVLESPREAIHDRAFNVGRTVENYRILEIAKIVADVVPGSSIDMAPGAGPDARCYRVDCSRIETELPGFEARWTVRQGIEELYQAFKATDLDEDDLQGPRYMRLRQIQRLIGSGSLSRDLRWQRAWTS